MGSIKKQVQGKIKLFIRLSEEMDAKIKSADNVVRDKTTHGKTEQSIRLMKSALGSDSVLKREKLASGNLVKRAPRRTIAETSVETSKSRAAQNGTTNTPKFISQRSRTMSNLEMCSDIKRTGERSSNGNHKSRGSIENDTVGSRPRRKISSSAVIMQRPRAGTSFSDTTSPRVAGENALSNNRSVERDDGYDQVSLVSVEEEPVGDMSKKRLGRTKSGPLRQVLDNGREIDQMLGSARKTRSSPDVDVLRTRKISTGCSERKEIIDKYIKDSPESNKSKDSSNSKIQEDDKLDQPEGNGNKSVNRGWGLLRKKLLEVTRQNEDSDKKVEQIEQSNKLNDDEATAEYWKMLRERLRNCKPADIVASSDVGEITKRKQDIERRKSTNRLKNGKSSFFETVLTAHALSKQGRLDTGPKRKTSTSSTRSARSDSLQSLPDISYNCKFKASPHFQRAMEQIMGTDDRLPEGGNGTLRLERPRTLATRYTF